MNHVLNKLIGKRVDNILIQLFRYTLVGGVAYIFDFSTLFFLTEFLNIHYLISAAIGFILGLIINYTLSILWVFSKHRLSKKSSEFIIFAFIGIIGLFINEILIWFFTEYILLHYLVSKVCSTIFVLLWNFFARKFLLFS